MAQAGQRLGYSLFGISIVLFVVALLTGLPSGLVIGIVVSLGIGSAVLAPAIVVAYGVKAADREDAQSRRLR